MQTPPLQPLSVGTANLSPLGVTIRHYTYGMSRPVSDYTSSLVIILGLDALPLVQMVCFLPVRVMIERYASGMCKPVSCFESYRGMITEFGRSLLAQMDSSWPVVVLIIQYVYGTGILGNASRFYRIILTV